MTILQKTAKKKKKKKNAFKRYFHILKTQMDDC